MTNLGYAVHHFHLSPEEKTWWWSMGTMTGLAVIAGAYCVCLATRRDPEAQFCLLCVAMLVGTVTVQGHYFKFLVFPLTVAATRIAARPTAGCGTGLTLVVLAVNWMHQPDFLSRHSILYLFGNDVPLYGLLAVGAFFLREQWSHRRSMNHPTSADEGFVVGID